MIERREALPRTYVVRCVRTAADVEAAIELLHGSAFRPRVEAIVTSADSAGTTRLAACSEAGTLLDTARIVGYESDRVTIEATCGAACLLILTDLHYPGWRAYVDGREQPVLPVNGLFRGVVLDPGEHGVVYRFEPGSFRLGVWLALACLLLTSLAFGSLRARLAAVTLLGARGRPRS